MEAFSSKILPKSLSESELKTVVKKALKIEPFGLPFGHHFGFKRGPRAPWGLQGPPGRAKWWPGEPPGSQKASKSVPKSLKTAQVQMDF